MKSAQNKVKYFFTKLNFQYSIIETVFGQNEILSKCQSNIDQKVEVLI